jgi:hypothetical protein
MTLTSAGAAKIFETMEPDWKEAVRDRFREISACASDPRESWLQAVADVAFDFIATLPPSRANIGDGIQ